MELGTAVWVKDTRGDQSWVASVVRSKDYLADGKVQLELVNDFGDCIRLTINDESDDVETLKLRNDAEEEEDVPNLISLPYLHEPAILFCLQQRYSLGEIYTYTGPILIAMNPFKKVPLYTDEILESYYNEGLLRSQGIESAQLAPHVYAIADAAYRDMMRAILSGFHRRGGAPANPANQSILISGESGAGKTESTKIVLRYLTTVGKSGGGTSVESGSVMDKVLQSNPILEAFGNARTVRNDNSSRFGKFIELSFNDHGHLIGGLIRTYLLEKVRLPSQQKGERNFHIFYQLVAGASDEERVRWGVASMQALRAFRYVQRGEVFQLRSVDDGQEFLALKQGLDTLNFAADDQTRLLDVTAALLHLGQVDFEAVHGREGEGSVVCGDCMDSLLLASQLLGLEVDRVVRCLTVRTIVARDESYEKKLTAQQAGDARDALAKALYGRLFDWIVRTINLSIQVEAALVRSSIGVLDIFGFECFAHNSFEQLCINYTNETLQQQFNQYIFKQEQIEYQREQINWSFIEFPDNQDCLDLIEHRVSGILAMVDDECRLPAAKDEKLAARMYKAYEGHGRFSATPAQRRDFRFCVRHYAGAVVYSALSFVEKNKDELPREATALLQGSSVPLLCNLFSAGASEGRSGEGGGGGGGAGVHCKSQNVGVQFKEQLQTLMRGIYVTTPHYIRCLKPNDENVSDTFSRLRITEQLRYGGVLEAVRVARSGFPVRLAHLDFYARYRPLANPFSPAVQGLPSFLHRGSSGSEQTKGLCAQLVTALWDDCVPEEGEGEEKGEGVSRSRRRSQLADLAQWRSKHAVDKQSVQLGLTKVFLRKTAHDVLESRRSRRIAAAARRIQSAFRCRQARARFLLMLGAARLLQRLVRGLLARRRARGMREQRACLRIQRQVRRSLHRRRFLLLRQAVLLLQSRARARAGRRAVQGVRAYVHAVRLQRVMQGATWRLRWLRFRRALVVLQSRWRRRKARQLLRVLRAAAKDVGRLQQSNEALKSEIDALKAHAAEERERLVEEAERRLQQREETAAQEQMQALQGELRGAQELLRIEREQHEGTRARLTEALRVGTNANANGKANSTARTSAAAVQVHPSPSPTGQLGVSVEVEEADGPDSALPTPPQPLIPRRQSLEGKRRGSLGAGLGGDGHGMPLQFSAREGRHSTSGRQSLSPPPPQEGQGGTEGAAALLMEERQARAVLEREVSRLQKIALDQKNDIDTLRRMGQQGGQGDRNLLSPTLSPGSPLHTPSSSPPRPPGPSKTPANRRGSTALLGPVQVLGIGGGAGRAIAVESASASVSASGGDSVRSVEQSQLQAQAVVGVFTKNVEAFRKKLAQGVRLRVREGQGQEGQFTEALLGLHPSLHSLTFTAAHKRGVFFSTARAAVPPVPLSEVADWQLGSTASTASDADADADDRAEQNLQLTLVTRPDPRRHSAPRMLTLQFSSRDVRNATLSGLRALCADAQLLPSRLTAAAIMAEEAGPLMREKQRTSRRLSVRDVVLEDQRRRLSVGGGGSPLGQSHQSFASPTSASLSHASTSAPGSTSAPAAMLLQVCAMANELADRDKCIETLQQREGAFQQRLSEKEAQAKQSMYTSYQMGKKLQDTLFDRAKLEEELEALKAQLDGIRTGTA